MLISYARDGEDVVFERVFGPSFKGTYVDIGAGDGRATCRLHERGWRGVIIERDQALCAALALARPGAVVLDAVAQVEDLRAVIEVGGVAAVDLVRLGATALAAASIAGSAAHSVNPRVVVVQASPAEVKEMSLGRSLAADGYVVGSFDGVNTYFAHADDEDALRTLYPACSLDEYVTTGVEALVRENLRLSTELERLDQDLRERIGADRTVLAAPSVRSRRYATRHDLIAAPVISLDRVMVVATPETGGAELAELLAAGLGVEMLSVEHPADIEWDRLPERVVVEVVCPFSDLSRIGFLAHAFRVVSIARNPIDSLLEYEFGKGAQEAGSDGQWVASDFVERASGNDAGERLNLNARWLIEPGTIRVDYEKLRLDPYRALVELVDELGMPIDDVTGSASEVSAVCARIQARLNDHAVDRSVLSVADVSRLGEAHELVFERLGFALPRPGVGLLVVADPSLSDRSQGDAQAGTEADDAR